MSALATKAPLLLEIGAEELPSSFVDAALEALPKIVEDKLAALRLAHGAVKPLGSPRRLSVIVEELASAQADLDEEVVGPPESAAYKDGKPTKAAEAFAGKLGVAVDALSIKEFQASGKQKAGRFLVGRRKETGRAAKDLLGQTLAEICAAIPFRKSMRWGDGDATFGRPVQWIVALYGSDLVDVKFAGVTSGRKSRGHRFLAPAEIEIASPSTYVEQLKKAHVLVDLKEREDTMMRRVDEAAKKLGGAFVPDQYLVDENASLVEEPYVVTGSFDRAYLELPSSVIIAVARGHQKYFCVEDSQKKLLPNYLAVVNTALAPANIVKGNDRTMGARLSDAKFFFEEDKKNGFSRWNDKISTIVFHARLGTVADKVVRLEKLAMHIAKAAGIGEVEGKEAEIAASFCKSDLASLMVGEFPELQGQMGRAYALADGKPERIANAIRDHYEPIGADGTIPKDDVAAIVALADRIDTLTGCFAVGLAPTGSADPYALRRNCIGALRLLSEHPRFEGLRWSDLIRASYKQFEAVFAAKKADLDENATVEKIKAFATDRLKGILAAKTSTAVADAVLGGVTWVDAVQNDVVELPRVAVEKALLLQKVSGEAWIPIAREVDKRLRGISAKAQPVLFHANEFSDPASVAKNAPIAKLADDLNLATGDWKNLSTALTQAKETSESLAKIFESILVDDPKDPDTHKRLSLLAHARSSMLRIADFSRLG